MQVLDPWNPHRLEEMMIRRVLLLSALSVFCLGALWGCTPAPGSGSYSATTVSPSTTTPPTVTAPPTTTSAE